MTDKEVMQMALDALTEAELDGNCEYGATDALRTAIAKLEPKPVAWMYDWTTNDGEFIQDWTTSEAETLRDTEPNIISNIRPLYTAPPRHEWVGLTDEEMMQCYDDVDWDSDQDVWLDFGETVQAKLKEKNT